MKNIQNTFQVISNKKVSPRLHHLSLDAPDMVHKIQPGQFVHIRVNEGLDPFFRRPFSVYRAKKYVEILYEVVGKGTCLLAQKKKGDVLDILGPLGNHFRPPDSEIQQVIMIAGGVGIAPFLSLSDVLKNKYELYLLYGSRTQDYIFDLKAFKQNGCHIFIATDDGSVGVKGRVSKLFNKIKINPQTSIIYTCGPRPMMAAVQSFAQKYQIPGQASCEETMACGLGACLGCVVKTTQGYKTVCYDGPVFDLKEIEIK